jgi:hypothetical protein
LSQFHFTQTVDPLTQVRDIIARVKTAMAYRDINGNPVQTHIGMVDVRPLAEAAHKMRINLPDDLVIDRDRKESGQFRIDPVGQLIYKIEEHLYRAYGMQPIEPGVTSQAATNRTAHFGPQVDQTHPHPQFFRAPVQAPAQPQPQPQFFQAPAEGQTTWVAPNPLAAPQPVTPDSPVADSAPPVTEPVTPQETFGIVDPSVDPPKQVSPAEQLGLVEPDPTVPPLSDATYDQMKVDAIEGVDARPEDTPSGKDESPAVPEITVVIPPESMYPLMSTSQIVDALSKRQLDLTPIHRETSFSECVLLSPRA